MRYVTAEWVELTDSGLVKQPTSMGVSRQRSELVGLSYISYRF